MPKPADFPDFQLPTEIWSFGTPPYTWYSDSSEYRGGIFGEHPGYYLDLAAGQTLDIAPPVSQPNPWCPVEIDIVNRGYIKRVRSVVNAGQPRIWFPQGMNIINRGKIDVWECYSATGRAQIFNTGYVGEIATHKNVISAWSGNMDVGVFNTGTINLVREQGTTSSNVTTVLNSGVIQKLEKFSGGQVVICNTGVISSSTITGWLTGCLRKLGNYGYMRTGVVFNPKSWQMVNSGTMLIDRWHWDEPAMLAASGGDASVLSPKADAQRSWNKGRMELIPSDKQFKVSYFTNTGTLYYGPAEFGYARLENNGGLAYSATNTVFTDRTRITNKARLSIADIRGALELTNTGAGAQAEIGSETLSTLTVQALWDNVRARTVITNDSGLVLRNLSIIAEDGKFTGEVANQSTRAVITNNSGTIRFLNDASAPKLQYADIINHGTVDFSTSAVEDGVVLDGKGTFRFALNEEGKSNWGCIKTIAGNNGRPTFYVYATGLVPGGDVRLFAEQGTVTSPKFNITPVVYDSQGTPHGDYELKAVAGAGMTTWILKSKASQAIRVRADIDLTKTK